LLAKKEFKMTAFNQQPTNISLDLTFAEQDAVQVLLGYPVIDPESTVVSPDLLYKFIDVTYQWVKENSETSEDLPGIKVGFERKVLVDSEKEQYRIESQFSSNSVWRSEYDHDIISGNLVRFLLDPHKEEDLEQTEDPETSEQNLNDTDISCRLVDRVGEEINRLYPKLKEGMETHVYVFWHIDSEKGTESFPPGTEAQSNCDCTDEDGNSKPNFSHRYRGGRIVSKCAISGC
jgi:hypothetical protein